MMLYLSAISIPFVLIFLAIFEDRV